MGVGLAATQLGILRRVLVFQAGPDSEPTALVNPEVEWLSEELVVAEEGCLSLPGVSMDVERPLHARFGGLDLSGEAVTIEASGLEARVLQHEIDHLDGVLILDRAPREQRKGALRALREGGSYSPPVEDGEEAVEAGEHREPRQNRERSPLHRGSRNGHGADRSPSLDEALMASIYLGTSEFAAHGPAPALRLLPPPGAGRSRRPIAAAGGGRRCARRRSPSSPASSGSSCCRARDVNAAESLERIRAVGPEVAALCAFGQLIARAAALRAADSERAPLAAAALARERRRSSARSWPGISAAGSASCGSAPGWTRARSPCVRRSRSGPRMTSRRSLTDWRCSAASS